MAPAVSAMWARGRTPRRSTHRAMAPRAASTSKVATPSTASIRLKVASMSPRRAPKISVPSSLPVRLTATTRQVPPPVLDGTVKGRRSSGEGLRWVANRAAATWGADWSFSRRPGPRRDTVPSAAMTPM